MLYELRGATRAECFFILHWGHETLSFDVKCVCVCASACVRVPAAHSAARPTRSVHPQAPDSSASSSRSRLPPPPPFSVNFSASF